MTLLRVLNLSVDFATPTSLIHAVRDVSFSIAAGEKVGIVGESGSGKTTTALALVRMIKKPGRIVSGSAHLDGVDLLKLDEEGIRRARLQTIAYVPQGGMNSLNPVLRIREQFLDGLWDHGQKRSRDEEAAAIRTGLEGVGLSHAVAEMFPHELSGGMKQRVCIAIAVAMQPRVIIADEPTSALDVISQRQVMNMLVEIQDRIGSGLLLIGHDMGLMAQATDRVVVMQHGCIVDDAPIRMMFAKPAHPYSKLLISSVPTVSNRKERNQAQAQPASGRMLLSLGNVSKTFGGIFGGKQKVALEPFSLSLSEDRPSVVAVVGQSGSGKTTLGRLILGLESPSGGEVLYRGMAIKRLHGKVAARYRREVQAIFQDPYGSFNPFYRVDRTLALPLLQFGVAKHRDEIYEIMTNACAAVGLSAPEVLDRFPHQLSGGQRQRLMVARALSLRPKLIVADEPVSMIDASLRMSILEHLRALKDEHNISIIYITHDLATAYHISDYVLVLHQGRVVEAGAPREVIERPRHPYTRALVDAIPWPDPNRAWSKATDQMTDGWNTSQIVRGQIDGISFGSAPSRLHHTITESAK
ncbi:ABC transporter ATP-binding protein [Mesorhizobium shangrilense]|uniref:ABC transporter ATP-binding protein n=1 Tax=Mesorhizobium shangrilense TaxID=460060 RepID=A0ABV2DTW2_9HYPH